MQTPPLPTLHGRFAKRGCAHADELFKPAYQRVNRARGTKILRCFPHCCPAHIPRSYCGSTIELHVDPPPGLSSNQIMVYARFRQRDDAPALRVGDRIALAAITHSLQSSSNTKAPWIQSRVRPQDAKTKLQQQTSSGSSSLVFEINPGRRWYYSWDSSKNSAKRATKHVLEAFVLWRERQGGETARCVSIVTSPSFTLVSFRRVTASETALIAEELKDQHQSEHDIGLSPESRSPEAGPREPLRASLRVLIKDEPVDSPRPFVIRRPPQLEPQAAPLAVTQERGRDVSNPLEIFFGVAMQYALGEAMPLLSKWMSLRSARAQPSSSLVDLARRRPLALKDARQTAVHVVWWLLTERETQAAWSDHTSRGASVLLDTPALRECHARWLRWVESHVECFLATLEQPSLHELAATLAASGYASRPLKVSSNRFGWSSFVAQAREQFTGVARPHRETVKRMLLRGAPWTCALDQVSVASLVREGGASQWCRPLQSDPQCLLQHLPVTMLFVFWQQLSSVHIDLNSASSPNVLTLATPAAIEGKTPLMELLLDNRYRICNVLPRGETTAAGPTTRLTGFRGDYIGTQLRDGSIQIDLFSWPSEGSELAMLRLRWTLRRDELLGGRLDIDVLVSKAELHANRSVDVVAATLKEKLALVSTWLPVYQMRLPYSRSIGDIHAY